MIPTKNSQIFSTTPDNQNTVTKKVFEREMPITKYHHMLGKFDLNNIPPLHRLLVQMFLKK